MNERNRNDEYVTRRRVRSEAESEQRRRVRTEEEQPPRRRTRTEEEQSPRRRVRTEEEQSPRRRVRTEEEQPPRRRTRTEEEQSPRRRIKNEEDMTPRRRSAWEEDERTGTRQEGRTLDKNSEELRAKRRQRHAEALGYDLEEMNGSGKSRVQNDKRYRSKEDEYDMGRKQNKKRLMWSIPDLILMIIQAVLSIMASYYLKKLLPMKFWIVLVLMLVFAFVLIVMGTRAKRQKGRGKKGKQKKNGKRIAARIASVILSIAMAIGCAAANKGFSALNSITGGKYQTHVISLVVKADSLYNDLEDMDGKNVAIATGLDIENVQKAVDEIQNKEKVGIVVTESANIIEAAEALSNNEIDAVLFNEAYRGVIEDSNENFEAETRIIYQYEIQEELKMDVVEKEVSKEPFSVYISGIDTYGPVSTVSRSDVNMIVTVNPTTKQILMTSIPRDYYVPLASFGVKDKLTHAGIYGVEESMGTLENLFGVEIDYYARVNFTSLINMVDALGGITVNNTQAFTSYHTQHYYPEGQISMDGDTALEFVRERYGLSGGDNDRVKNQQKVLTAMLEKAMSPAIIKNYSSILDAVSGSFVTNMASEDIQSLIQMQLDDMASWNIEQIAVSGSGTRSTSCYSSPGSSLYVMEPDYDTVNEAAAKIEAVENGNNE